VLSKAGNNFVRRFRRAVIFVLAVSALAATWPAHAAQASPTNIFAPASTPADAIYKLSLFVLAITGAIFVVVFSLLAYAVIKYRRRTNDDGKEPPQVYGSTQVELAWTVIPVLIVVVLFLTSARVIHAVQDAHQPKNAIEVTAIGHQFWWEYRYPQLGIVTANELHIPVSHGKDPSPTFLTLLSSDTDHSFWVPRLAGKTDLIPNRTNHMWLDPEHPGLYLGQCAQYCGTQHAKMLLRVYVDSPADFERWVKQQQAPMAIDAKVMEGKEIFESTACVNCHRVAGTAAQGQFGPDLTHFASRETLAAGAAPNDRSDLWLWIKNPDAIKPGALMPAMNLSDRELDAVTAYLMTLR
jgi:cytochrome c oxidase subunit 2